MECHRRVCHLKDHGVSFRRMFSEENNGVSPPRLPFERPWSVIPPHVFRGKTMECHRRVCHLKDHGVSFLHMFSEGKPWSVTSAFAI